MADASAEPPESARKRRRTAQACLTCRQRKTKCNGQRPSCSNCEVLAIECHYDASDNSSNILIPKSYVANLEERLHQVERNLKHHDSILNQHLSNCAVPARDGGTSIAPSAEEEPGPRTDGLGLVLVEETTYAFFGESANITFTRQLTKATSAICGLNGVADLRLGLTAESEGPTSRTHSDIITPAAPSDFCSSSTSEPDRLLMVYFRTIGLLFPFLHEPTFWRRYGSTQDSPEASRAFLGMVNLMIAYAVNSDREGYSDSHTRLARSRYYYTKAVAVVDDFKQSSFGLDTIQYLLLLTLYRQGTQGALRTWIIHGQLVQAALAIGLHAEHARSNIDPIESESRRRTWLTIYCLDKVLSATLGRPSAIPEARLLPMHVMPWPVEPLSHTAGLVASSAVFFGVSVELYRIMDRSVTKQYSGNAGLKSGSSDELSEIRLTAELRQTLHGWAHALPPDLKVLQTQDLASLTTEPAAQRLQIILTLRYYSIYLLVHRPLITMALGRSHDSSAGLTRSSQTHQFIVSEAELCLSAARCTVDIAHAMIKSAADGNNRLGVWYFNLYYVFSAALVIYAFELLHLSTPSASCRSFTGDSYLAKAEETIVQLDTGNHLTASCARYLGYLRSLLSVYTAKTVHGATEDSIHVTAQASIAQPFPTSVGFDDFYCNDLAISEFLDLGWIDHPIRVEEQS